MFSHTTFKNLKILRVLKQYRISWTCFLKCYIFNKGNFFLFRLFKLKCDLGSILSSFKRIKKERFCSKFVEKLKKVKEKKKLEVEKKRKALSIGCRWCVLALVLNIISEGDLLKSIEQKKQKNRFFCLFLSLFAHTSCFHKRKFHSKKNLFMYERVNSIFWLLPQNYYLKCKLLNALKCNYNSSHNEYFASIYCKNYELYWFLY